MVQAGLAGHFGLDELAVVELTIAVRIDLAQHLVDLVLSELVPQRAAEDRHLKILKKTKIQLNK
jgi:hypothetical protein